MGLFKADKAVIQAGSQYLKTYSIDFILVAIKFNLNGFLNGCGRTTFAMVNGVASSIFVRVPVAFLLAIYLSKGLIGLGLAAPIASMVSIINSLIFMKLGSWNKSLVKE